MSNMDPNIEDAADTRHDVPFPMRDEGSHARMFTPVEDVTGLNKFAQERTPLLADTGEHQEPIARNPWHGDGKVRPGFVPVEAFGHAIDDLPRPAPHEGNPGGYVTPNHDPQGLQWNVGNGFARHDLAAFPHERNRDFVSNVELRTMHAHLMEAVALARAEMRERGMVVDF